MFRSKLNKGKFAKSFRRGISKTKRINLAPPADAWRHPALSHALHQPPPGFPPGRGRHLVCGAW